LPWSKEEEEHQLQDIGIVQVAHADADGETANKIQCVIQLPYLFLKIHNTELNFMVLLLYRPP